MSTTMHPTDSQQPESSSEYWGQRKAANRRLGWTVGLIVLIIFLGTLWKYRPL